MIVIIVVRCLLILYLKKNKNFFLPTSILMRFVSDMFPFTAFFCFPAMKIFSFKIFKRLKKKKFFSSYTKDGNEKHLKNEHKEFFLPFKRRKKGKKDCLKKCVRVIIEKRLVERM